jgi:hypothetical protein
MKHDGEHVDPNYPVQVTDYYERDEIQHVVDDFRRKNIAFCVVGKACNRKDKSHKYGIFREWLRGDSYDQLSEFPDVTQSRVIERYGKPKPIGAIPFLLCSNMDTFDIVDFGYQFDRVFREKRERIA